MSLFFCNCKEQSKTKSSQPVSSIEINKHVLVDSLDTNTSSNFITSNFPKNVHDTVYSSLLKSQWELVKITFEHNSTFDLNYFRTQVENNNFIADTVNDVILYSKRLFNKREFLLIDYLSKSTFNCQFQCLYWFNKQKYSTVIDAVFPIHLTDKSKLIFKY